MKKVTNYFLVDKEYITENATILFNLYELNEDGKNVKLFLSEGTRINGDHKIQIRYSRPLYILTDQRESYDNYTALHLRMIAQNDAIPFERKSSALYEKAEEVMTQLFANPEALGNVQKAQTVVDDMIVTILDDNFTVNSMMKIAAHDYYTHTHSINVSIYALSLGKFLGLKHEDMKDLGQSALLHDLGKSKVHTEIINKNGKLTITEYDEMMHHPAWGDEIAKNIGISDQRILSGIRHHHEKLDGTGYPDKLTEDKISQFAKIIAVCDVFDALTTKRSYKDAMTSFEAFKLIKEQMNGHLDMQIVNTFLKNLTDKTN